MNKRVVLGISGGVDSAVAALLLQQEGYDVIGLFMRNWEEKDENGVCTSEQDFLDAKNVCQQLDIPYYSLNFSAQYMEKVFSYFLDEYAKGRTPNPDVLCNREIKFGPFLEYAMSLNADYIATGHYCGIEHANGNHYLLKAKDSSKDQTYFLCQLNQNQLERVLFPLANYTKRQVREIAQVNNLSVATKKDSTGICFIGERNFRQFISNYFPARQGDIVDTQGNKVGEHSGLMYYTLGQRKGLGLGGTHDGQEGRWFVLSKDVTNNLLVVSHGDESPLYDSACTVNQLNWIPTAPQNTQFECQAKFRYRQEEQDVRVSMQGNNHCLVEFAHKQRAVTPGQFAVFYSGNQCLGGGTIQQVIK
ncbi:MAG: tRNA 2-thiouridine(34) synthase MnmA [Clostridia bacterium]|nr:tRNA 2-thiouridine(34) synthase MnmA [Clostridia bacterium]